MVRYFVVLMVAALFMCGTSAMAGPDINPGKWQSKSVMKIAGMPFSPPPITYTHCMTEEDTVPRSPESEDKCTMVDTSVSGNTVTWRMECESEGGKSISTGSITYNGDSYAGTVDVVTSGMTMNSTITGKRLGACD